MQPGAAHIIPATKTSKHYRAVAALIALRASQACAANQSYGFTVDVSLSPKATALLKSKTEGIVVSAMYQGEPIPSKVDKAEDDGTISLGDEDITIPGAPRRAVITGTKVIRAHMGWVKELQILINVYSVRRSSPDNLLDCGICEGSIAQAQAKPIAISCKLIGEP